MANKTIKHNKHVNEFPYNLRNSRILASKHKHKIKYRVDTIAFKGLQIWQIISLDLRNSLGHNIKQMQITSFIAAKSVSHSYKV